MDSFGTNHEPQGKYPAAEPGPSGRAAPSIGPTQDAIDETVEYFGSDGESGPAPEVAEGLGDVAEGVAEALENEGVRNVLVFLVCVLTRNPRPRALAQRWNIIKHGGY